MKKIIIIMIACVLALAFTISGCRQEAPAPATEAPAETAATEAPSEAPATEAPAEVPADIAQAAKDFGLDDIPEIQNKTPITVVMEAGFWTEWAENNVVPLFAEKTGIEVRIDPMPLDVTYSKQNLEFINKSGAYDVVNIEASMCPEWSMNGFLYPFEELAAEYDPMGVDGWKAYEDAYYRSLLNILSWEGQVMALPYQNYTMIMYYRKDIFENAEEKAAFEDEYGYALAPPTDFDQLMDMVKFFTRSSGETLAGETLTEDFYGNALMAGRYPHIQDENSSILWGMGGDWFSPVRDDSGVITGYNVRCNDEIGVEALTYYTELLEYAPPDSINWLWADTAAAFNTGRTAILPAAYGNVHGLITPNMSYDEMLEKIGMAEVVGKKPYFGAYAFGIDRNSQNPEAAYWFVKFFGSYDGASLYAEGGGTPCRIDLATEDKWTNEEFFAAKGSLPTMGQAMESLGDFPLSSGHFTSGAMGKIYNELMISCSKIASGEMSVQAGLDELAGIITQLQNEWGDAPVVD
jgi:multiple sugar transport system substrate-binding protein